jgi:single-strand DNA-binding protein
MNIFTGIGRIGRDAITRHTTSGKAVTSWALAIDSGYGDNRQTIWLDCSMWDERGAKVGEYICKGDKLGVTGELGTREHDGKTYVTLRVANVDLLAPKRDVPSQDKPKPAPAPQEEFSDDIPF